MNRFTYTFRDLLPGAEALEYTMGYEPGTAPEPVTILINEVSDELLTAGDIKAEYKLFNDVKLDKYSKTVEIEGVVFCIKPIIFRQIEGANEVALFICSAGPLVGEMSRNSMKEGDLLRGYVYDVIGSAVVENAADRMQSKLKEATTDRGMMITNRFSPGYCGWDVAEQHKLFSFFKDNFCGITLSESALMHPIKSVSGLIGIGENVKYAPYICHMCDDKNCIYRNRKIIIRD